MPVREHDCSLGVRVRPQHLLQHQLRHRQTVEMCKENFAGSAPKFCTPRGRADARALCDTSAVLPRYVHPPRHLLGPRAWRNDVGSVVAEWATRRPSGEAPTGPR